MNTAPVNDKPERVTHRLARAMARHGAAGAMLAFLLLRAEALLPAALLHVKSIKAMPVAVLCCAELTWLFGWTVGALLAAQWALYVFVRVRTLRGHGVIAGWRAACPLVGLSMALPEQAAMRREDEALAALQPALAALIGATVLFGYGQLLASPALLLAAKCGFGLLVLSLLPFRPFDGASLFPGLIWRVNRHEPREDCPDSARFLIRCRRLSALWCREDANRPRSNPRVLADCLFAMLFASAGLLAATRIFLPPLAFGLMLLLAFVAIATFVGAILSLDPAIVRQPPHNGLSPRRRLDRTATVTAPMERSWRSRSTAFAALTLYLTLTLAAMAGLVAA